MTLNKLHIYAGDSTNTMSTTDNYTSYEAGANAGDVLSSKTLNTAIRTSTLISKALIDALTSSQSISEISHLTSSDDVKQFIKEGVSAIKVKNAVNADKATIAERIRYSKNKYMVANHINSYTYYERFACSEIYSGDLEPGFFYVEYLGSWNGKDFDRYGLGVIRIDSSTDKIFFPQSSVITNFAGSGSFNLYTVVGYLQDTYAYIARILISVRSSLIEEVTVENYDEHELRFYYM